MKMEEIAEHAMATRAGRDTRFRLSALGLLIQIVVVLVIPTLFCVFDFFAVVGSERYGLPIGALVAVLIFLGLFRFGGSLHRCWIRDNCGNDISSNMVRLCPVCRAELE